MYVTVYYVSIILWTNNFATNKKVKEKELHIAEDYSCKTHEYWAFIHESYYNPFAPPLYISI